MNHLVSPITSVGWFSSLTLHAVAVACLLRSGADEHTPRPPAIVTMSVVAPPRVAPPPVPAAANEAKPSVPERALAPRSAPPVMKELTKVAANDKAPIDLTGVTLTGGDGAGWSSMIGNGQAMDAPIRPATVTTRPADDTAPTGSAMVPRNLPPPAQVVPAKDLASKPAPPSLNASLLANYPALAKRQGLTGSAKLLVRIDSDGVVRQCTVQSESSADFGTACRRTLLGSRWSPPRDRLGKAVVTQVYYTCDFRVNGS